MQRSLMKLAIRDLSALVSLPRHEGISIITYHSVSETGVNKELFRKQMEFLAENCDVIALKEIETALQLPLKGKKRVIITFDDGYEDVYSSAFEITKTLNLPFTVFLVTGFLSSKPPEEANLYSGLKMLDRNQVLKMACSGLVTFARHSHKHIDFSIANQVDLSEDIKENRKFIEDLCGENALLDMIAYPFGKKPPDNCMVKLSESGIRMAFVVDNDLANSRQMVERPFGISRIHIDSQDNLWRFRNKLDGKYRTISRIASSLRKNVIRSAL